MSPVSTMSSTTMTSRPPTSWSRSFDDAHPAHRLGRVAVARQRHVVDGERETDLSDQVREEQRAALQDRDQDGRAPLIVPGDGAAELLDPATDVLASEQDACDLRHPPDRSRGISRTGVEHGPDGVGDGGAGPYPPGPDPGGGGRRARSVTRGRTVADAQVGHLDPQRADDLAGERWERRVRVEHDLLRVTSASTGMSATSEPPGGHRDVAASIRTVPERLAVGDDLPPLEGRGTRGRGGRRRPRTPRLDAPSTTATRRRPSRSATATMQEPAAAGEPGLHADRPRVQPQERVAVLDDARRQVARRRGDLAGARRDDAREPGSRVGGTGDRRRGRARSSSRGRRDRWGDANRVSLRPRWRTRAFMSFTNASTVPETCSARAIAASFADWSISAVRGGRPRGSAPPSAGPSSEIPAVRPSPEARALTVTMSCGSVRSRTSSAVTIFVTLAIGTTLVRVPLEQDLPGVEVGQDRRLRRDLGRPARRLRRVEHARERRQRRPAVRQQHGRGRGRRRRRAGHRRDPGATASTAPGPGRRPTRRGPVGRARARSPAQDRYWRRFVRSSAVFSLREALASSVSEPIAVRRASGLPLAAGHGLRPRDLEARLASRRPGAGTVS